MMDKLVGTLEMVWGSGIGTKDTWSMVVALVVPTFIVFFIDLQVHKEKPHNE